MERFEVEDFGRKNEKMDHAKVAVHLFDSRLFGEPDTSFMDWLVQLSQCR